MATMTVEIGKENELSVDLKPASPVGKAVKIPFALVERLNTKSPIKPLTDKSKRTDNAALLRAAHIDSVKERATRQLARGEQVKLQKTAALHASVDKASAKLNLVTQRVAVMQEKMAAKVLAAKERRERLAAAVAETREMQKIARKQRSAELFAAEQLASAKREKSIQAITERSAHEVKKALSVAATLKENKRQATESAAVALTMRLEAAEARRLVAMSNKSPEKRLGSPYKSPNTVRHKVLNDSKVDMGMKRRLFDEQMDKATSNRKAHIQEVTDKASAVTARAASRAAAAKGLSAAVEAKKHAIYEKMNAADVARATVLRQRATATVGKERRDDAKATLLVFPNQTTRQPPAAWTQRLREKRH